MSSLSVFEKDGLIMPDDPEYFRVVQEIWENAAVQSMHAYLQHGTTSCLQHSLNVSYLSYRYCRDHHLNARAAARAGLLHDLFLYDWHCYRRQKGERLHGFEHPRKALANAEKFFALTPMETDIILRHMWPLTLTPPSTRESYVVVMFDKYVSLLEALRCSVLQDLSGEAGAAGAWQRMRKLLGLHG